MARGKTSLMEDLLGIAAKLLWWVGVGLALLAYLVFHAVAGVQIALRADAESIGQSVVRQMLKSVATVLQYVVPLTFLGGALMSVLGRKKREALHAAVRGDSVALSQMTWQSFEKVVGEYFRRKGFAVSETGGGGADGGVDLVLTRGMDRYVVQCKQWRARQVGVAPVRELFGVMTASGAAGGYVVTSGVFTEEARRFAEGREIELIAGDQLAWLIQTQGTAKAPPPAAASGAAPACPKCATPMVMRTASQGSNAGSSFWGCPKFPACRGTRPGQ